ncbi:hypothetical protein SAMN04487967_3511 [Natronorubrum sediminis]|uniref:Uncharacterized protein n=1 Tax=Natronorubrum sediminis TaxID=640943 RepID=A0A1H6G6M3_9EURY|nr:hypothetical protein SAMN04487967_3511 [Natronorubrum sediminis]
MRAIRETDDTVHVTEYIHRSEKGQRFNCTVGLLEAGTDGVFDRVEAVALE